MMAVHPTGFARYPSGNARFFLSSLARGDSGRWSVLFTCFYFFILRSPCSWIGPVDPMLFLECLVARVDHLVPYSLNAFVIFVACVRYPTLGMLTEPFVSGIRHWECALGSFCFLFGVACPELVLQKFRNSRCLGPSFV